MPTDYYKKIRERYKKNPDDYWNFVASKYKNEDAVLVPGDIKIKNAYYDSVQRKVLSKAFKKLNAGSRMLDFGCGVGRWSIELAERGMNVIGIDISSEMIKLAKSNAEKKKIRNVGFLVAKNNEINFPYERFDGVLAITVFQHILDDKKRLAILERLIKVTKKGGKFFILEKVVPEKFKEFHVNPLTEKEWINIFESRGTKFLESYPVPSSALVEFVTSLGTKLKYRNRREVSEYPGSKSAEEILSKPMRAIYTAATRTAIAISKPIDLAMQNKFLGRSSKHKLMIFEKV